MSVLDATFHLFMFLELEQPCVPEWLSSAAKVDEQLLVIEAEINLLTLQGY